MLSFYIALYDIGDSTTHHWGLIAAEHGTDIAAGRVNVFQIVTRKSGSTGEDGYMAGHGRFALLQTGRFICAVPLPNLNMTMPQLERYMMDQPVGRRDTPLIQVPWGRWECSQWVIRAIKGLIDAGVVVPQSKRSFFTPAAAGSGFWASMIQTAGTKCAHATRANRGAADTSSGVAIMTMATSGINL